jgi:Mrp family chromosome partitioning ATPase
VSAIETPPAVADRPAVRTFAPLAPVVEAPAPLRAAPLKLRLPTVLSQILRDAPDHWEHLSRGVEARVKESGLRSLLVTSALQGEGATTVATALAVTVAQKTDLKVLLLDADFAHPCLADQLKLGVRVGLEHHLLDATPLAQVTVAVEEPVFDILPTLEPFQLPAMAHSSRRLEDVLDELRRHYDLIIVDLGALFADRKPIRIPLGVDAALIVRDPARCSPDLLDQLDAYIARQGVSSLGVIENGV